MVESSLEVKSSHVLVVEDEVEIRELISLLLLRSGHSVQQCANGQEALAQIKTTKFDLVVLDWMMPQLNGIEFIKSMHGENIRTPVLMVTAKTEPQDIVVGLDSGADDYVTKPFAPAVFAARVRALLRRSQKSEPSNIKTELIQLGDLAINLASYEVLCKNQPIHLTPSEFKILATMAGNQGRVLTRDHLIEVVQGEGISVTGRTIDTHVFGLRKKLNECADWIETIRGVGYRIRMEL